MESLSRTDLFLFFLATPTPYPFGFARFPFLFLHRFHCHIRPSKFFLTFPGCLLSLSYEGEPIFRLLPYELTRSLLTPRLRCFLSSLLMTPHSFSCNDPFLPQPYSPLNLPLCCRDGAAIFTVIFFFLVIEFVVSFFLSLPPCTSTFHCLPFFSLFLAPWAPFLSVKEPLSFTSFCRPIMICFHASPFCETSTILLFSEVIGKTSPLAVLSFLLTPPFWRMEHSPD